MLCCRPLLALLIAASAWGAPATAQADPAGSPGAGAGADLGSAHACAVQRDRQVRCWGRGTSGRLGSGATSDLLAAPDTAPSAPPVGPATAVTSGDAHTCALTVAASVRCWGQGGSGQLGGGTRDNRLDGATGASGADDPTTVPLGAAATAISAGGDFTCALVDAGTVRCWGDGAFGELGSRGTDNRLDGLAHGPTDDPATVPLGGPATALSAGPQHACAVMATGTVRCWGNGGQGRLGTGGTDDRLDGVLSPAGTDEASVVPLAGPAVAVSAGGAHSCALLSSGAVSCWGAGAYGQLGAGRNDDRLEGVVAGTGPAVTDAATTVVLKAASVAQKDYVMAPPATAIAIAAGEAHTCAITTDGEVRCWGEGDAGQLGQGAVDARLESNATQVADAATRVAGGPAGLAGPGLGGPAVAISAAYDSACATLSSGAVRCWGSGLDGRLGSSATDPRLDGIIDGATKTDEASTVPVGPVAGSTAELAQVPNPAAPQAAPSPAPPTPGAPRSVPLTGAGTAPLSAKFAIKGRTATIAVLMKPAKSGTCPERARAIARERKKLLGKASLRVAAKGGLCRAFGTIRFRSAPKRHAAVTISIRAKGVAARLVKPTR